MTVTMADCRKAGYCVAGVRRWLEANGIEWRDFVRNGVAVERVEQIDDAMSQAVIAIAKGRANG